MAAQSEALQTSNIDMLVIIPVFRDKGSMSKAALKTEVCMVKFMFNIAKVKSPELHNFLELLLKAVHEKFADEIVSIALFGSATTDEWVKGRSDIDFIVIVKNRGNRKKVEQCLNELMLDLDERFDMGFRETCSSYRQRRNPVLRLVDSVESWFTFGRPFYVLSMDQIDFDTLDIDDFRIKIMTLGFDSLSIFAAKLKMTGVTVYGEDFIERLQINPSRSDKLRATLSPLWILLVASATLLFDRSFSLQHAVKATVWACEDVLFAIDEPLSSTEEEFQRISHVFSGSKYINFGHLAKTLRYRLEKPVLKRAISFGSALRYLTGSYYFVGMLYVHVLLRHFKRFLT